ncbi:MAG TPA: DUF4276 family protein [Syntrophales bacterium]|nr:DUF4276 family protein [Syntrophales bacterium]
MHVEFLVEEYSAEEALRNILPLILQGKMTFDIHAFNGKHDLLACLPNRLKGYRAWLPEDSRIVVLVDRDTDDCYKLKAELERMVRQAGFTSKTAAAVSGQFEVLNRIAIEELEAWFFGDPIALKEAYPRVSGNIGNRAPYREPDAIAGGTWEALERVLMKAGYYPGGMPKVEVARNISKNMQPLRNTSKSFQIFRDALHELSPGASS